MAKTTTEVSDPAQTAVGSIGAELRELIEAVPESNREDAQYNIVMAILAAKDASELDNPWSATAGLGAYNDRVITIRHIRRSPSSFEGGPGVFLILDVKTEDDGDEHVVTTGSVSVVVQLLKAFQLGAFPLTCIPKVSKRQTARGYWPQHLEIVRPDEG